MCYAKPGPRCSAHAANALTAAKAGWDRAVTDDERTRAMATLKEAREQYDTTPVGQMHLADAVRWGRDSDGLLSARLEHGIAKRKQMLKDIKAKDVGDISDNNSPVISPDGTKSWWAIRKLHREDDNTAFNVKKEYNPDRGWYLSGERHREGDKSAVEGADGLPEGNPMNDAVRTTAAATYEARAAARSAYNTWTVANDAYLVANDAYKGAVGTYAARAFAKMQAARHDAMVALNAYEAARSFAATAYNTLHS